MPVFAYTLDRENPSLAEKIELAPLFDPNKPLSSEQQRLQNQRIREMRAFLMRECVDIAKYGMQRGDAARVINTGIELAVNLGLIKKASPEDLPADPVHNILIEDESETSVKIDWETGVAIGFNQDGAYTQGDELNPNSLNALESELSGDETAILQAVKQGFTYHAYAIEPRPGKHQDYTEHTSLGFGTDVDYTPVVTVLDETHPVRQLIENPQAVSQA